MLKTTANSSGSSIGELRYKAWGEQRFSSGTTYTKRHFTGQYQESTLGGLEGLYFYNSRWYDSSLGRFAQADSIIPEPGNPQAWDRFAYTLNNPLRFTDPSGHYYYDPGCDCLVDNGVNVMQYKDYLYYNHKENPIDLRNSEYLIHMKPNVANGLRIEFTFPNQIARDVNVDYLYFNETGERKLFTSASPLQINLFPLQDKLNISAGFIHVENVPTSKSVQGISTVWGLDLPIPRTPISLEIDNSHGQPNPDGSIPEIWYIGIVPGTEFQFYISPISYTVFPQDIFTSVNVFFEIFYDQ